MVEMADISTTLHASPPSRLIPISPFLLSIFLVAAMSRRAIRVIRGSTTTLGNKHVRTLQTEFLCHLNAVFQLTHIGIPAV